PAAYRARSGLVGCGVHVLGLDDALVVEPGAVVGEPDVVDRRCREQAQAALLVGEERALQVAHVDPLVPQPGGRIGGGGGKLLQPVGRGRGEEALDEVGSHSVSADWWTVPAASR